MKKFSEILAKCQEHFTLVLTIILPLLVVVQVLLRYVFNAPLFGIEELMLFPIIWLYMIGGANASRKRCHIDCGILTLYIKEGTKGRAVFNLIRSTISIIVSIWLTYWAYWYFMYSLNTWKYSPLLKIPMFFGESAVLVGLVLMTAYTIVEWIDVFKALRDYKHNLTTTTTEEEVKEC
ncbi:MAG: TRAP transporter small permease [Clostridia bacterium]|nr:TRAP transporter small permease [Clostridia bacterium]